MKKAFAILLVCAILLGLTSCKDEINDNDETKTTVVEESDAQTTTEEEKEDVDADIEVCNHSWNDATCTKGMICALCGVVAGDPIGHNYSYATCTSPAKCVICNDTKGNAFGHQYSDGYCVRCNEKDPKHVAYGTLKGTVTYKYNDYVGHKGDAGASVMVIPRGDDVNTAKYDNARAAALYNGVYESGIVVTECDGNGNYVFDNLPAGKYVMLIVSRETTDGVAFDDEDYYKGIIRACYKDCFSEKDLETLVIMIGFQKYKYSYIEILEDRTHTVSHDFGYTYI